MRIRKSDTLEVMGEGEIDLTAVKEARAHYYLLFHEEPDTLCISHNHYRELIKVAENVAYLSRETEVEPRKFMGMELKVDLEDGEEWSVGKTNSKVYNR